MNQKDLHYLQVSILRDLGYEEEKTFTQLQGDCPSNKLAFHLKQLVKNDLITKTEEEKYRTTKKGREVIIEILGKDTTNPVALLSLIVFKGDKLFLERQKNPLTIFKDMYRLPTDKVRTQERMKETSERIYRNIFGNSLEEYRHLGYFDKRVKLSDGVEQKYLLFYMMADYSGERTDGFYDLSEIGEIDIIPGVDKVIEAVERDRDKKLNGEWDVRQDSAGDFHIEKFDL